MTQMLIFHFPVTFEKCFRNQLLRSAISNLIAFMVENGEPLAAMSSKLAAASLQGGLVGAPAKAGEFF